MASYDIIVKLVDQTKSGLKNIEGGLTSIQTRTEQVNKTLASLGAGLTRAGAVAAASLGLAAKSALTYADAIQDASNASGIATPTILAFSQGVATSGGTATKAVDAMVKFADAVGTAATGSYSSRKAFDAVNISLADLRTLSEEDLFKKTIDGLASISDLSLRASVQTNIFGKTLKGVDVGGFAGDLARLTAEQQKNAAAIKAGAATVDQLKIAYGKLELAILKAIQPLVDQFNKLNPDQLDRLITSILKLSAAIVGLSVGVKVFSALGAALSAAAGYFLLFSKGVQTVVKTASFLPGGIRIFFAELASGGGILAAGLTLLSKWIKNLSYFALGFSKMVPLLATVTTVAWLVDEAVKAAFNFSPIDAFTNSVGNAYDSLKQFLGLGGKKPAATALPAISSGLTADQANAARAEFAKTDPRLKMGNTAKPDPYIEGLIDQLKQAGEEYASFSSAARDTKNLNLASLAFAGLSSAAEKLGKVAIKPAALVLRDFNLELDKQRAALKIAEIEYGNTAGQIAKFDLELQKSANDLSIQELRLGQTALMSEKFRQEIQTQTIALTENQGKLDDSANQQKIYKNEILAGLQALQDQTQRLNNASLQQALYTDELAKAALSLQDQTQRLGDARLQQGLYTDELARGALALKDQQQRLADAALQQGLFDQNLQKTRGDLAQQQTTLNLLNTAYDAGKISLKEYADALSNVNAELLGSKELMSQAQSAANQEVRTTALRKQALQDLITKYKEAGGTGTEAFKKAAEALGGNTTKINAVATRYGTYADQVEEYNRAIEDSVNSAAGTFVDEFSAAFMKGEGMLDSFRNFFSNIMNDIATRIIKKQLTEPIADALNGMISGLLNGGGAGGGGGLLGGILGSLFGKGTVGGGGDIFGSLFSSIGSFFGFANGGMIGAGQTGIVGENGPEYITGPANITPMDSAGGSGPAPNVSFTINAIDTQTGVQFLLQNKPAIVSMVSQAYNERGRRGVTG